MFVDHDCFMKEHREFPVAPLIDESSMCESRNGHSDTGETQEMKRLDMGLSGPSDSSKLVSEKDMRVFQ
jgi:hypothetical protein